VARGYRPSALRYLLLSSHYRKQLNFTWTGIEQAEESLRRLTDFLDRLKTIDDPAAHSDVALRVKKARDEFSAAIEADLNTAAALAAIFDLVRDINVAIDGKQVGAPDASEVLRAVEDFDQVLGVISLRRAEDSRPPVPIEEIERLIEERHAARRRRDFKAADDIRNGLAERGILLEDNSAGTRWKRK
jgi:cysteinyl-tRNA synthetase